MDLKSVLFGAYGDRRLAFSRNTSFRQADWLPNLSRSDSTISITADDDAYEELLWTLGGEESRKTESVLSVLGALLVSLIRSARFGTRPMKRLALMISLNVAYSITELMIGLLTGRVGCTAITPLFYESQAKAMRAFVYVKHITPSKPRSAIRRAVQIFTAMTLSEDQR